MLPRGSRAGLRRALLPALAVALGVPALTLGTPAGAATTSPCGDSAQRPWCNTALSPDQRALLLQQAMTETEEIQLLGGDVAHEAPHTGATYAIPRLGIPAVYFSDGPVGPRQGEATAMPIPMALAATFDRGAVAAEGAEIADEAKAKGNDVVFAPTVNIMRTPQGGRTFEAYGEDPFLVASSAVSWIEAAQGQGVLADIKHLAANNQEGQLGVPPITGALGSRTFVDANVDARTLHEIYFPAFEAAVKQADVATVMCSYNRLNGTYACENGQLLQQVLEHDWGFRGMVVSDYGAAHDTVANLNNGLDFEPSGPALTLLSYNPQQIQLALDSGLVSRATLDEHVRRMLRTFFAYGIFDRSRYVDSDAQIDKPAHAATAEQVEEHAITLLRNDGVLPLPASTRSIAVIGPYADRFVTGGGSGQVKPFSVTTALAGIKARAGSGVRVSYADGSDQSAAVAAAKAADVAVVVVGDIETEGNDKACAGLNCANDLVNNEGMTLTGGGCSTPLPPNCPINGSDQDGLISAVAAANPHTVVVLETGAPVLTPWRGQVGALLEAWYPGQEGGTAIARVLFGDADPGGRLPVTFPASVSQLPTAGSVAQYPGLGVEEYYTEGVDVGYRWYDAHGLTPAYPFGFGLSYATVRYSGLQVRPGSGGAVVTVDVTNAGSRPGVAVPQLYLGLPSTAVPQPPWQLKGYDSISLAPGQSARVTFPVNARSLAYFDTASNSWRVAPGCYQVAVGSSSRDLGTPLVAAVGGASCPGAVTSLPVGDPNAAAVVPPAPQVQVLAAAAPARPAALSSADAPARPASAVLADTGLAAGVPLLGVLLVGAAGLLRRRLR